MPAGVHQPFVPVPSTARVRLAGLFQGAAWNNRFAVKYNGAAPDAPTLNAFATAVRQAWGTAFTTHFATGTSLQFVQVWDISSATGASGLDSVAVPATGVATGLLPVNAAIVVSWHVQIRYRGGHFRWYMVPRVQADIQNGRTLLQTTIDAYKGAATTFYNAINSLMIGGLSVAMGGVHYDPPRVVPKTQGTFYPYSLPVVHSRLDTQRRRLGKELN